MEKGFQRIRLLLWKTAREAGASMGFSEWKMHNSPISCLFRFSLPPLPSRKEKEDDKKGLLFTGDCDILYSQGQRKRKGGTALENARKRGKKRKGSAGGAGRRAMGRGGLVGGAV
jgi:hypothetical protein